VTGERRKGEKKKPVREGGTYSILPEVDQHAVEKKGKKKGRGRASRMRVKKIARGKKITVFEKTQGPRR